MLERIIRAASRKKVKPVTTPEPGQADLTTPAKPTKPPGWEDELYSAGDICAPEPDRDDEQRGL